MLDPAMAPSRSIVCSPARRLQGNRQLRQQEATFGSCARVRQMRRPSPGFRSLRPPPCPTNCRRRTKRRPSATVSETGALRLEPKRRSRPISSSRQRLNRQGRLALSAVNRCPTIRFRHRYSAARRQAWRTGPRFVASRQVGINELTLTEAVDPGSPSSGYLGLSRFAASRCSSIYRC